MYEIKTAKNLLRKKYSDIRQNIASEYNLKKEFDQKICRTVTTLASFRFADTVLIYAPMGTEIDVTDISLAALQTGKKVAFPRCEPKTSTMCYHYVDSLDMLKPGAYSILEPDGSLSEYSFSDPKRAVCIVPGIVFDESGYRLGYGKGYYDRYFSMRRDHDCDGINVVLIGVAYSSCVVKDVPHGKFDLAVDILVTEKGVKK